MKDIQTYKLTATTPNGAKGFISRFETNLHEELGHPYTPTMRKYTFLSNIIDPAYATVVEILEANDDKTFEDCILEMRRKASDLDDKGQNRH